MTSCATSLKDEPSSSCSAESLPPIARILNGASPRFLWNNPQMEDTLKARASVPCPKPRLRWTLATMAGVLTLMLMAPVTAAEEQVTTLRVAIAGDENNLTPFGITFRSGKTIDLIPLVYDSLFYSAFQEEPELWLAEDVETSDDARTWTVTVRDDVQWHDGEPLTAEDVRFSYEYFSNHESPLYSHHVNDRPFIESVEVLEGNQVEFTCRAACPTFDVNPGAHIPILPMHVWEEVTEPNRFTEELPVGSGPYELVRYAPDQVYVLEANADYFMGEPTVDEITMPIIPESSAMFLALQTGEVDTVSRSVPPESLSQLEDAGLEITHMTDYGSVAIDFNNQRPPLTVPELRRALNLAVDTEQITTTLLQDLGKPGQAAYLDPDSPFADPDLGPEFETDEAERLLDSIGFVDSDGDGTRETDEGKPLAFEVLVESVAAREVRAAELAAGQLAEVGVQLNVTPMDPATLRERTQSDDEAGETGNFDMQLRQLTGGHFHFDPDGLMYLFQCPGPDSPALLFTGYCNDDFDELAAEAAGLGFEERKEPLREAQEILNEEPPGISLYFPDSTFAYNSEAYTGWVEEIGHGIFHKRSFLPTTAQTEPAGEDTDEDTDEDPAEVPGAGAGSGDSGGIPTAVIVGLVLALVLALIVFTIARKRPASEHTGPEVD